MNDGDTIRAYVSNLDSVIIEPISTMEGRTHSDHEVGLRVVLLSALFLFSFQVRTYIVNNVRYNLQSVGQVTGIPIACGQWEEQIPSTKCHFDTQCKCHLSSYR